ncbi:hypothetical protein [Streptomyces sp. NPDC058297]|uniref:hypothetical protein n=1 Tax=unclassified Streptomyces TaxID=2593676 RepID=UPI0036E2B896
MKKILRGLGIGSVALACVFVSSGGAQAATTGHGKSYHACKNYVKIWRSHGKVYAYGTQVCSKKRSIQRPEAAISAYKNGEFKDISKGQLGSCHNKKTCKSPKASLKVHKGYTYRALNAGTASIGIPDEGDYLWPKKTQAQAYYKAR